MLGAKLRLVIARFIGDPCHLETARRQTTLSMFKLRRVVSDAMARRVGSQPTKFRKWKARNNYAVVSVTMSARWPLRKRDKAMHE